MPRRIFPFLWPILTGVLAVFCQAGDSSPPTPPVHTFSIVARDPQTGEIGIAVASRIVAVGAIVPHAKAGVGAVATQALANVACGPAALSLLGTGTPPDQVLARFQRQDSGMDHRQIAILPAAGPPVAFTGKDCSAAAGHLTFPDFTVQGNLLASHEVLPAMAKAFQAAPGLLEDRLIAALRAGQQAGGDRRGRQSAALLIVREGWGYGGANDRYRDLRVDDHPEPIEELARILELHRRLFPRPAD